MSIIDQNNINPMEQIAHMAHNLLNLSSWHFKESYRSTDPGKIIFNSEWCRINLIWGGWDNENGISIDIRYGRLHAPNDKAVMIWNGEDCRCWHRVEYGLHFLDKRTPAETAKINYSHPITLPFYEEDARLKFSSQPEWLAKMHTTIWQQYGTRLFELFDLRRTNLWQEYRHFLKEVYDVAGRIPAIKPPLDKVC